jgi:hypothetical protein
LRSPRHDRSRSRQIGVKAQAGRRCGVAAARRMARVCRSGRATGSKLLQGDAELLELIRRSVRSVWALELLLLMRRSAERSWTPDELVSELRASQTLVADNLPVLETTGLVLSEDGRYRYAPATPLLEALCARLDEEYRLRPVAVINAIASTPNDRLHKLANAFRLKGDT